ncbi:mannose-6-phosphate isomerase [Leifsonia sp. AK011]|uniref:mannose-6-phosphate isomerase, class I n=1 Tax=Leifsonia sp. AK011 TaxID=2723075 RepID=UPI0015CED283|nr:mannose-6-phosphate isomerase, class I [Leifsonia sp. AK011]NYF11521.1 mannose-6-phosphate isomerase [Leifsonia sp. AK011]
MFVGITNEARDYAWGGVGAISRLFGHAESTRPEAELWLGAHHGSPSRVIGVGGTDAAASVDLAEWIAADPTKRVGAHREGRLPFLLKVLAAGGPLSLQAHPTTEQAQEGFARENAAGIPLDAPHRSYKDPHAKPELILAVSDTFDALCGFQASEETRASLERMSALAHPEEQRALARMLDRLGDDESLRAAFAWLLSLTTGVDDVITAVSHVASRNADDFPVQAELAALYPGDPGIAISLMLHEVTLAKGEALYLPAGNIHAYLHGVGIELMEASDNVLRGGLTPKHVDVAELLSVLDFTPRSAPYLVPEVPVPDVRVFRPEDASFELIEFEGDGPCPLDGPAIALCVSGSFMISGRDSVTLSRGEAVYVTPDEGDLTVEGTGQLVVATTV